MDRKESVAISFGVLFLYILISIFSALFNTFIFISSVLLLVSTFFSSVLLLVSIFIWYKKNKLSLIDKIFKNIVVRRTAGLLYIFNSLIYLIGYLTLSFGYKQDFFNDYLLIVIIFFVQIIIGTFLTINYSRCKSSKEELQTTVGVLFIYIVLNLFSVAGISVWQLISIIPRFIIAALILLWLLKNKIRLRNDILNNNMVRWSAGLMCIYSSLFIVMEYGSRLWIGMMAPIYINRYLFDSAIPFVIHLAITVAGFVLFFRYKQSEIEEPGLITANTGLKILRFFNIVLILMSGFVLLMFVPFRPNNHLDILAAFSSFVSSILVFIINASVVVLSFRIKNRMKMRVISVILTIVSGIYFIPIFLFFSFFFILALLNIPILPSM